VWAIKYRLLDCRNYNGSKSELYIFYIYPIQFNIMAQRKNNRDNLLFPLKIEIKHPKTNELYPHIYCIKKLSKYTKIA